MPRLAGSPYDRTRAPAVLGVSPRSAATWLRGLGCPRARLTLAPSHHLGAHLLLPLLTSDPEQTSALFGAAGWGPRSGARSAHMSRLPGHPRCPTSTPCSTCPASPWSPFHPSPPQGPGFCSCKRMAHHGQGPPRLSGGQRAQNEVTWCPGGRPSHRALWGGLHSFCQNLKARTSPGPPGRMKRARAGCLSSPQRPSRPGLHPSTHSGHL